MLSALSTRRTRTLRVSALAVTTLAAALTLSACQGDDGAADSSAPKESSAPAQPDGTDSSTGSDSTGNGTSGNASSGNGSSGSADSKGPSQQPADTSRCHTSDLAIDFAAGHGGTDTGGTEQRAAIVLMNNTSKRTCTLQGFPGVDLKSADSSWSLTRSDESATKTTLKPGDNTQFTIKFMPWAKGSGKQFQPESVVVTPPNATESVTLDWAWNSILLQDGATHPGTYVNPIGS